MRWRGRHQSALLAARLRKAAGVGFRTDKSPTCVSLVT